MSEAPWTLASLWDAAWAVLSQTPGREVTLATLSVGGWPEVRTVILRRADPEAAVCEVHTDLGSHKIASLRACPRAALVYWDLKTRLQLRLRCDVQIRTWPDTRVAWARVPDRSQTAYGKRPAPGTRIETSLAYDLCPSPEAFAILQLSARDVDILHLGPHHRRAAYARTEDWQGHWLSP